MSRRNLRMNLLSAFCLAAFAAALWATPSQAGRGVSLAEADSVRGAACSGPATSTGKFCSITYTNGKWTCQSCGCPSTNNPGSGTYNYAAQPCGAQGCGDKPAWSGNCGGS